MHITSNSINQTQQHRHLLIGVFLIGWLSVVAALALNDTFVSAPGEIPLAILLSFVSTFSFFSIAYMTIPAFREYLLGIDMRLLIMLHSWRMLGLGFVMLYLFDQLPGSFALLAGFGDALTAVAAVILAYAMFRSRNGVARQWILRWNTFGLLDFLVAVSVGILTRSDALLAPVNGVSSDLMTTFPLVAIPGFLVQVFALTHIIIYLQLRNNHRHDERVKLA